MKARIPPKIPKQPMNIIVKMTKFYQDLTKLSANLVEQKFTKSTHTFIAEVC